MIRFDLAVIASLGELREAQIGAGSVVSALAVACLTTVAHSTSGTGNAPDAYSPPRHIELGTLQRCLGQR
ncbi:MAG: hypothetical protein KDK97_18975 [Verrucomicrobiales bacterium]|nr:hypothetical protein [Verrucomicrobiales bacterium]